MNSWIRFQGALFLACVLASEVVTAAEPQAPAKDLNTPRTFPKVLTRTQWQERACEIREQILASCGLWPMREKTPLNARVFGKVERDGYSVEKVYLQAAPGFYLAGNLYRPLGNGRGPFPGVLNPHGHWKDGRLADTKDGSIAARCIGFARRGMVAFSYDMVGFNDTHFADAPTNRPFYEVHRQFGAGRADQLWSISLMGLQTWNSIRALDFLESLPDVDRKRLACTGESGGGTQTYMLGAIDDRLAAQAPVVMVSHTMQGGCSCENAPGLRVEYSNMEIAAAAAPRPQILVAATGDWTKATLTVEGPAIAQIYQLLGAPEKLRYVRFDFGHNYNQTSREAVYEWFGKWLLQRPEPVGEAAYRKEPDAELRVFPENKLPADAMTQEQFTQSLKERHRRQWQALVPRKKGELERYKASMQPAWRHTLQLEWPAGQTQTRAGQVREIGLFTTATIKIGRAGDGNNIQATYWAPPGILSDRSPRIVVLCDGEADNAQTDTDKKPAGLPLTLLQRGMAVLVVDHFTACEPPDPFANFYTTYNRTKLQERVRDLQAVCAAARSAEPRKPMTFRVMLAGVGRAGLWALLAAPAAEAVIADTVQLDVSSDEALLASDLFCPGLRNIGAFEGAAILAAPHPMLVHNTGADFRTDTLQAAYKAVRAGNKLRAESRRLTEEELAQWADGALKR